MRTALALSVIALLLGVTQASAGSTKTALVNVEPTNAADASGDVSPSEASTADASAGDDGRGEASQVAAPEETPAVSRSARKQGKRSRGYDQSDAYAQEEAAYERQTAAAYRRQARAMGLPDCDTLRGYARSYGGY